MDKSFLVAIGKVAKAHGVRGALKILPYGETLGEIEAGEKLYLAEGGTQSELTLVDIRPQNAVGSLSSQKLRAESRRRR